MFQLKSKLFLGWLIHMFWFLGLNVVSNYSTFTWTKPVFLKIFQFWLHATVGLVLVITWLRGRLQINFPTRFTKSEISRAKRGKFDFVNWGGKLICNLPSGMWLLVNPTQEHTLTWCYNVRFDVRSDENIDYFRLSVTNKLDEVEKSFTSQKTYVIESCLSANPAVISPKGLWLCNIRNINFVIIAVFDVIFVISPAKKTFH